MATSLRVAPPTNPAAARAPAESFAEFEAEVSRLVAKFESEFTAVNDAGYSEARVRQDYLDPLFRALGWDLENRAGLVQQHREVEIESRTDIAGRAKRADYLFRTGGRDKFICEAKRPREDLGPRYAFQAKRYAWNKSVAIAVLTDFEEIKIYVVGGRPHLDDQDAGLWKRWDFRELPSVAGDLWKLLSREGVAGGSIEALLETLPKAPTRGRSRRRQLYLIRPDRTRSLDAEFLNFLDEARRELASDLLRENARAELLEAGRLNEAVQSILDRLLFLRICEDRDIETGMRMQSVVERWHRGRAGDDGDTHRQGALRAAEGRSAEWAPERQRRQPREGLWETLLTQIRALDHRPPTHVPYFNGNLFKHHFSEELVVSDEWLTDFIGELSADESPYLFNVIPVEILGSVYERFLGKIVRPHGRGVVIEEKPEVRHAGGVYYTPRYVVDYIVEETLGRRLDEIAEFRTREPFERDTRALRVLDPACGSGSFLIGVFERICEHWQRWLTRHPEQQARTLCWIDPASGDVHLAIDLKRRILRDNIYGVDIDPGAVEVTQLSLYLKMLEGESRITLDRQRELLSRDTPLLPPLETNIKCGNSLIASDFTDGILPIHDLAQELKRVNAFDWDQAFPDIIEGGGFNAVVGNPPYIQIENIPTDHRQYFLRTYGEDGKLGKRYDIYQVFVMRAASLLKDGGRLGYILPNTFLMGHSYSLLRKRLVTTGKVPQLVDLPQGVFHGVTVDNVMLFFERCGNESARNNSRIEINKLNPKSDKARVGERAWDESFALEQGRLSAADEWRINVHTNPKQARLFEKVERSGVTLGDVTESSQGIILYKTAADAKRARFTSATRASGWKRLLRGKNIARYETIWGGEYVSYGDWLWCQREEKFFNQPKILLHAMRNKSLARRLVGTYDEDEHYNAHNLANIIAKPGAALSLKFVLGIFNSALINYWYRAHFPNVNINPSDFRQIPIPPLDLANAGDKARHDLLVTFVEKVLALTPKLRDGASERETSVIQNAVRATDAKIDDLVFELYGLTAEERALVDQV